MEREVVFNVYSDGICVRRSLPHGKALALIHKLLEEGTICEPCGAPVAPKKAPPVVKKSTRVAEAASEAAKAARADSVKAAVKGAEIRTGYKLSSYPIQKFKKAKGK